MHTDILTAIRAAGITLAVDGGNLIVTPKTAITDDIRTRIRANKPAILAALAHPNDITLWWRVAITEPGARTVEVDTPSAWTLADWQAYAERYHGPGCAVKPIAGLPKPQAPVNLDEALRTACEGVEGITKAQFRSLLSPEDIDDIAAGAIHPKTLHGYALSFAEGMR